MKETGKYCLETITALQKQDLDNSNQHLTVIEQKKQIDRLYEEIREKTRLLELSQMQIEDVRGIAG